MHQFQHLDDYATPIQTPIACPVVVDAIAPTALDLHGSVQPPVSDRTLRASWP